MNDNRAKEALCKICKSRGTGDEKEVKKIVDAHPSIINEVRIKTHIILLLILNMISYDFIGFRFSW